jgi:hypothetical protein
MRVCVRMLAFPRVRAHADNVRGCVQVIEEDVSVAATSATKGPGQSISERQLAGQSDRPCFRSV